MKKSQTCPILEASKLIGDPAVLLLIKCLSSGEKRYKEVQEYVSQVVSDATLCARLKKLEKAEVIERKKYNEIPPRVMYNLTEKGKAMIAVVDSIEQFAYTYHE